MFRIGTKKKEYRCTPTFVNLKSNTMKNTLQRYEVIFEHASKSGKKVIMCNII